MKCPKCAKGSLHRMGLELVYQCDRCESYFIERVYRRFVECGRNSYPVPDGAKSEEVLQ